MKKSVLENFKNLEIPKQLKDFIQFMSDEETSSIDFEVIENGNEEITRLYNSTISKELIVLGQHGSGSLIVLWQIGKTKIEEMPVAWLDSEGDPLSVFANNYLELLGLLYLNTGNICDIINTTNNFQLDPDDSINPKHKYTDAELNKRIEKVKRKNEGYSKVVDFLDSIGIAKDPSPVITIGNAIENNKKISEWIESNL